MNKLRTSRMTETVKRRSLVVLVAVVGFLLAGVQTLAMSATRLLLSARRHIGHLPSAVDVVVTQAASNAHGRPAACCTIEIRGHSLPAEFQEVLDGHLDDIVNSTRESEYDQVLKTQTLDAEHAQRMKSLEQRTLVETYTPEAAHVA